MRHELELLDEELPRLINDRNPKAWDILKVIKGNVFLLVHVDFELLTKLDRSLISEMNKEQNSYSGDFFSDMIWIGTDSYNTDYDSGCGSDGGDGSGCSGCGGCGGCGGCS